jgi:hypothetical protein
VHHLKGSASSISVHHEPQKLAPIHDVKELAPSIKIDVVHANLEKTGGTASTIAIFARGAGG